MKCYRCNSWPCTCRDGITLIHGDCLTVLRDFVMTGGRIADVMVTDPPYGIDGGSGTIGKRGRASRITWPDTIADIRGTYAPAVTYALALCLGRGIMTPGAPNAFEYPKPSDIGSINQPCATGCSRWGRATCQPVLFYGKDPRAGKHLDPICITQTTRAKKSGHPTPKPEAVAEWMVTRASLVGETILDPFTGGGAFLVAAKKLHRKGIGIEIEERYCEIAANRLRQEVLFPAESA